MKLFKIFICACSVLLFACQSETDSILPEYKISAKDETRVLSHIPTGEISEDAIKINFGYDEFIAQHIEQYGEYLLDTIGTFGKLLSVYKDRNPIFTFSYSDYLNPYTDNDYVFPKLEYWLAQECYREDCSSQTRKAVLQTAIEKQKYKYEPYVSSFTTRRTGIFLISVILIKEQDSAFLQSVVKDTDLQNALCLNQNIRTDDKFKDIIISYAENFLSNQ